MSKTCKAFYDKSFYHAIAEQSVRSAQIIIPFVLEKIKGADIHSCVDFGCGDGAWLSVVKTHVEKADVLGLDFGEPTKEQLKIDPKEYRKADLSDSIFLNRTYDLCISLEVAEHINAKCADIVLFSATLPGQGGSNHVNEQNLTY